MCTAVVVIRGGGDIGTGVALRLWNSGFDVVITEIEHPRVIRREVAFAPAVYKGCMQVEGVRGIKSDTLDDISNLLKERNIPVVVDPECSVVNALNPAVVVDALLAKKNRGMGKDMAPLTIGLGPGFEAGRDVHVVIETNRGHNLGRVIIRDVHNQIRVFQKLLKDTGKSGCCVHRATGKLKMFCTLVIRLNRMRRYAYVGESEVRSLISGVLRGIIMNGVEVTRGLKIGDVDPRGIREHCFTVSDKARAIGGGVLEAILSVGQGIKVPKNGEAE